MTAKELSELLKDLGACEDAHEWSMDKDLATVWTTCERGDWMLWLAGRMLDKPGWGDLRNLTLAKARCAGLVRHLLKDDRSIKALDVAERFGLGHATREELDESAHTAYAASASASAAYAAYAASAAYAAYAASAAYAAYAASAAASASAYAAYAASVSSYTAAAAARKETLSKCADICREIIKTPLQ